MDFRKTIIIAGAILLTLTVLFSPASASSDENYLVMYIIGSDLEYDESKITDPSDYTEQRQAATENMIDLVNNWDSEMGDVLVFYGGSTKTGWNNGVSITNLELLKEDLKDYVMGVDVDTNSPTKYILGKINGEIASYDALYSAMSYSKDYSAKNGLDSAKSTLIIWNHGGGYSGIGPNSATQNSLTLDEINSGLSGSEFDIIAFDACLMGSLEVASSVYTYADYLVGSEELVPGTGYNYAEFAYALSNNPSMSAESFAISIVDAFSHSNADEKTLSVLKLDRTPSVISSLNNFGDNLYSAIIEDYDSLITISDIYFDTKNYYNMGIDLYQFAKLVYDNAEGNLKYNAGVLLSEIDNYVVYRYGDPQYNGVSNGVTVAAFNSGFLNGIPNTVSFGRSGWYNYFSTMMDALEFESDYEEYDSSAKSYKPNVWSTVELGDFLYDKNGEYIIIGQIPLEDIYKEGNSIWNQIPTGEYKEPEWKGGWFSFGSANPGIFASMNYDYEFFEGNTQYCVYDIYGDLKRDSVTHPSVVTAVVNMDKMAVEDIYVTSVDEDNEIWSARSNEWVTTDIFEGDVFTPMIDIYDEESNTISSKLSSESFTFTKNPVGDLSFKELNNDNVYWIEETLNYIEDKSVYSEEQKLPESKSAQSPAPFLSIMGALAVLVFFNRRK